MGFLDELRQRAETARQRQDSDVQALARSAGLADVACRAAFQYFAALAQQLDVLRPRAGGCYRLDARHAVEDPELCDFRADARRKRLRGDDVYDHVVLRWRVASGVALRLSKDFVPEVEQLEARLRQGGVTFDVEAVRAPESTKLREMRYAFVADFEASVLVTPDHATGRVHFHLVNLGALETVQMELPAFEVGAARLDELARWIVGERHAFLDGALALRRHRP